MIPYTEGRLRALREVAENQVMRMYRRDIHRIYWCRPDAETLDQGRSRALNDLILAELIVDIEMAQGLSAVELTEAGEDALHEWSTPEGRSSARRHDGWRRNPAPAIWELAPGPPNGCAGCGVDRQEHFQRWAPGPGLHTWIEPSDELRLARMQHNRMERA